MKMKFSVLPALAASTLWVAFHAEAAPKKVLVVTTTAGFRHSSIETAENVIATLGEQSGAFTVVDYVRGRGLLRGIVLTAPHAKAVETAARDAGFLVNAAAPDVIRLAPPLIITEDQIAVFLDALPAILAGVSA